VVQAARNAEPIAAQFSMDMFSLGRMAMWLVCADKNMWPGLYDTDEFSDESRAAKEELLLSESEFDVSAIADAQIRDKVAALVKKSPNQRWTLEQLKA
jgi:hypothetical protein